MSNIQEASTDTVEIINPSPKVRKGDRHRRLKKVARRLAAAKCPPRDLLPIVSAYNQYYCEPPLDDRKVREIVVGAHCDAIAARSIAGKVK